MRELPPWSRLQASQLRGTIKQCLPLMSHAQAYLAWVTLIAVCPRVLHAKPVLVCRLKAAPQQLDAASIAQSSCPL